MATRRELLVFTLVAYGGAYAIDAALVTLPFARFFALPFLVARMGMVTLGVLAAGVTGGRELRGYLERLGLRPSGLGWGLVGALMGAASCLLAALLAAVLGLGEPDGVYAPLAEYLGIPSWLLALLLVAAGLAAGLTVNALAALLEEVGWRGFLLDALRPLGRLAPVVVGVAWGVWHAPLVALLGYNYRGVGGLPALAVFTLYATVLTLPLVWLRERSGSLYPPSAMHGAINALGGVWDAFYSTRPWANLLAPPAGLSASASVLAVYAAARLAERVVHGWRGGAGRG